MEPVETVRGNAIPLDRADVDTDQIIPKQFLKRIERTGFGPFAFYDWRKDDDFVANRDEYQGAPILLAGANFGCGSSREHAVWALEDMGVQAIIAPSFADIFRNNCSKVGLLTVELPAEDVQWLLARAEESPEAEIIVDLREQTVSVPGGRWERHFDIDPFTKHRLLNGLDDIGLTLQHEADIASFERVRRGPMPTTADAF